MSRIMHRQFLLIVTDNVQAPQQPRRKPKLSQADCRRIVMKAFRRQGDRVFDPILDVEGMSLSELRQTKTTGSILEVATKALRARGILTSANVRRLTARTGLNRAQLHAIACGCNGDQVTGRSAARRMYRSRHMH